VVNQSRSPVIAISHLTKRFGDFTAVDDLSLVVEQGEIMGMLGPNGSGKTTTLDMVSGLSRPTAGTVTVLGHDVTRHSRAIRAILGVVPQETALYEELSAWTNLMFHADLFGVPGSVRERRATELLNLVQLYDRRTSRVGTFSGGMKRRLALARALLHDPKLLYFDEPTLGVDVQSRRALWDYILALKDQGKTILLTTNYLEEANALCDRIAIIDRGKLIVVDSPANLKQAYGHTILELVIVPAPSPALLERLRALPGVADVSVIDRTLKLTFTGERSPAGQVIGLVTQEAEVRSIAQREPNLDEIFLRLTGTALRD
jgi:ABC-2 type transport system ATP-binding protein